MTRVAVATPMPKPDSGPHNHGLSGCIATIAQRLPRGAVAGRALTMCEPTMCGPVISGTGLCVQCHEDSASSARRPEPGPEATERGVAQGVAQRRFLPLGHGGAG